MDGDTILLIAAIGAIIFAACELLQVYIMLRAVRAIKDRVFGILPPDKSAGDIIAEAVVSFMRDLNASPERQAVVGGFIRGAALAGYEEISKRVPLLKGGADINASIEKAVGKNPWAGLIFGIAQAAAPMLQQKIAEIPNNGSKKGGNW